MNRGTFAWGEFHFVTAYLPSHALVHKNHVQGGGLERDLGRPFFIRRNSCTEMHFTKCLRNSAHQHNRLLRVES